MKYECNGMIVTGVLAMDEMNRMNARLDLNVIKRGWIMEMDKEKGESDECE